MKVFYIGASLTGILITLFVLFHLHTTLSHSFFSHIVRTTISNLQIVDFVPPAVQIRLTTASRVFTPPANTVLIDTHHFTGEESIEIELLESVQNLQLSLQFEGAFGQYQEESCFSVYVDNTELFRVQCSEIKDAESHVVLLPLALIHEADVQKIRFLSNLPEHSILTLSTVRTDTWILVDTFTLRMDVTDHSEVTVRSNWGSFIEEAGTYTFVTPEFTTHQEPLEISVKDAYGNSVSRQLNLVIPENRKEEVIVRPTLEPAAGWHILADMPDTISWYNPVYVRGEAFSDTIGTWSTWYPVARYSELASYVSSQKKQQFVSNTYQRYTVIETE